MLCLETTRSSLIEELREGHISPALRASMMAHQAGIYSMAVLLHIMSLTVDAYAMMEETVTEKYYI
jgi:hypothetical protein